MDIKLQSGQMLFLQLEPELDDGTIINFSGAAAEVVADASLATVATNPADPSQISVSSVASNIGTTTVTITYTNPDGKTAQLLLNIEVDAPDATKLDAKQIGDAVPVGTAFPGTVVPPVAPTVTAISPASGAAAGGDTLTLTGTGFTGATAVNLGPNPAANFSVVNDTTITAVSAAFPGPGVFDVAVTGPNGTGTLTGGYTAS